MAIADSGRLVSFCLLLLSGLVASAAPDEFDRILAFEGAHKGDKPAGWHAYPADTVRVDDRQVHGGKWSVRIERDRTSGGRFTALGRSLAIDFGGKQVELRGFLRTEAVRKYAGLWLRQDAGRRVVALDNMQRQGLHGTNDWAEYRITMDLHPEARQMVFGALLSGEGKVWVDDLQLLVDGKPAATAPKVERRADAPDTGEVAKRSGVAVAGLTPAQIRNLTLLGKVWGFLKYHHPSVTAGQRNWDRELFGVLPDVLKAANRAAGNAALFAWCKQMGAAPARGPALSEPKGKGIHLQPSLEWIRDGEKLGADLSAWLSAVHANRHRGGTQHYVSVDPAGAGNPGFEHEKPYPDPAYPDAGYRILALYRFWNIIAYWFPYRDLIEEDWDGVLAEFLPRLVAAKDADAYRLQMMALIARVHDTHANLWNSLDVRPPRGSAAVPVLTRFVEGRAVVVDFARKGGGPVEGLQVGDVVLALDGRPVAELVKAWAPYYAASNEPTRLRDIGRFLTRGKPGPCGLRIERNGEAMELTVERVSFDKIDQRKGRFHDRPGKTFQKLSPEVAYLKLSSIREDQIDDYLRSARGTKGLVIDIRNYPSNFVVFSLGQRLVREPTLFACFTRCDLTNPGVFAWSEPQVLHPSPPLYEGRVAILVDEVSQSQAEYTTMAFRTAPDAVVVGSTTAGADGNVSRIPLPGGLGAAISGIGVFYPDKTPTQRLGIVPDVQVRPTIAGIRAGRDEVLEEALRQILGKDVPDEEIVRMAR